MKIQNILQGKDSDEVFTMDCKTMVTEAVNQMTQRNFGAVLVTDNGELSGIFTERDLMSCVAYCHGDLRNLTLKDVMTKDPKTISSGADIMQALSTMTEGRFRHLPITNDNGKLEGVVSYIDIVKWLMPSAMKKSGASSATAFLYRYASTVVSVALLACVLLVFVTLSG